MPTGSEQKKLFPLAVRELYEERTGKPFPRNVQVGQVFKGGRVARVTVLLYNKGAARREGGTPQSE